MKSYFLLILAAIVISCSSGEKNCTINGEIIGRKNASILLFKATRFPVYEAEIPIKNSAFTYSFKFVQPEAYLLIFKDEFQKGSMNETPFFSESGTINFSIHSDRDLKGNLVKGHQLNNTMIEYYQTLKTKFYDELGRYTDSLNALYRNGTIYTKDFQALQDALKKTKDQEGREQLMAQQRVLKSTGSMYSPKAKRYVQKQDSILNKQKLWEFEYMDKNTSILSFYLYMNNIKEIASSNNWQAMDAALINQGRKNLDRFAVQFPDHPYIPIIKNTLDGLLNIHTGGKINDFKSTDIKGDSLLLSDIIKSNKVTLLNFWSKISPPTIKISNDMLPLYKQYKDKGFGIVGITQAFGNADELVNFIKTANYPWPNLIDHDNNAGVWEKYNLSYQSGGTFLVDDHGKILAVNPTPDNVKEKLATMLK